MKNNTTHRPNRRHVLAFGCAAVLAKPAIIKSGVANASTMTAEVSGYRRLFPALQGCAFNPADLRRLADGDGQELTGMTAQPEVIKDKKGEPKRDAAGHLIVSATAEDKQDDEENFGIPSGYTYLGQFVDHDLTLNPSDALTTEPRDTHVNLRSARFDLDNLYGRGPADRPYLYEPNGRRLVEGRQLTLNGVPSRFRDHPRSNNTALIGDKRNDENIIVSQLHGAFRAFHNFVADDDRSADFERLQRTVAQHYQWILLTDFLPRLCGQQTVSEILPGYGLAGRNGEVRPQLKITSELKAGELPLEFSSAAYRMGHSMVRPAYRLNTRMQGTAEERRANPDLAGRRLIFAASQYGGLNGFRSFPAEWGIDWKLYFEIDSKLDIARLGDGARRVQAAYKFDSSLVNPLAFLPEFSQAGRNGDMMKDANGQPKAKEGMISSLALRNLMRGAQHGLPSGQAVARAMGLEPIPDHQLLVGKATVEGLTENKPITAYGDSFRDQAPLWFYVLAEAQHLWAERARSSQAGKEERDALPSRLGPVGGRIVAETFVALMMQDPSSVLNAGPDWRPRYTRKDRFTMAELIGSPGLA